MSRNNYILNAPMPLSPLATTRPYATQHTSSGLNVLAQLDKIIVKQKVELLEVLTEWEGSNKYEIKNSAGQQLFFAFEKSDICMRLCCKNNRGFTINIVDNNNQECLRITREFKCCAGCCWFAGCCDSCAFEIKVETASGEVLGYVRQKGSCWSPKFQILDANGYEDLEINGPCCICDGPCCPHATEFDILSNDGSPVGKVAKEYSGFVKEMFSKADNFTVEFPIHLPVSQKATLLGALFLIDFMFFEKSESNNNSNNHK